MADLTNHNKELTITEMVYNRLAFLAKTEPNDNVISDFILEVSWELEPCFKVRFSADGLIDDTRVAVEGNYTVGQKTLIADLVSLYILMQFAVGVTPVSETTGGTGGTTTTSAAATYIKKAVAGSVQVEYDLIDSSTTVGGSFYDKLKLDVKDLLEMYQQRVRNKAAMYGCVLAVCQDFCKNLGISAQASPFIVVSNRGCVRKDLPPERFSSQ